MSDLNLMFATSLLMLVLDPEKITLDNYAIGYFKKQGFTTDISLEKSLWMGYIKDYEGGTIMQCQMVDKVNYQNVASIISAQRRVLRISNFKKAVFEMIKKYVPKSQIVRPGIKNIKNNSKINPEDIPGLIEGGWRKDSSNE